MKLSTICVLLFVTTIPVACWYLGNRLGGFRSEDIEITFQEHQAKSHLRELKQKQQQLLDAKHRAMELESGMINALVQQYESTTDETQKEWYARQILDARERLHVLSQTAAVGEGGQ